VTRNLSRIEIAASHKFYCLLHFQALKSTALALALQSEALTWALSPEALALALSRNLSVVCKFSAEDNKPLYILGSDIQPQTQADISRIILFYKFNYRSALPSMTLDLGLCRKAKTP